MTRTEYEQKKVGLWNELFSADPMRCTFTALEKIFDRAYALGKQTETIAQEDIEKAAEAFATPPIGNGGMFTRQQVKELLVRFAQLLLSKQEKDANANIKFQKQ